MGDRHSQKTAQRHSEVSVANTTDMTLTKAERHRLDSSNTGFVLKIDSVVTLGPHIPAFLLQCVKLSEIRHPYPRFYY